MNKESISEEGFALRIDVLTNMDRIFTNAMLKKQYLDSPVLYYVVT